jgi:L-iditol 2-dehydrogenase
MKALILERYNELAYRDVAAPDIVEDEVLVRVAACGICGSDIHGMDGSTGRRIPPLIMGHEAAGVIARVGPAVSQWAPGDRVTFDSTIYCGQCFHCRRGEINLCDNRRVLGVSPGAYRQHGAFAEYVAVPQRILYRLPEGLAFEDAVLVEPLSIALHAVRRTPLVVGDTAVVVGAGMVGLMVVQALRVAGCGRIIAVDLDAARLALARKLGATDALRSDAGDVLAEILALTNGCGADRAFEVVGIAPTVQLAVGCVRKGGSVTLVGNLAKSVEVPLQAIVTRELTLYAACASQGEYPACLDLIARGRVNVQALISAVAPLSEGAEWFDRLYHHGAGMLKVILRPEGESNGA